MELEQAKKAVMEASKQLVALGLVARTWGNVSCRVGEGSFLITPSGKPYEHLQKDQLVLVDLEDLSYPKGVKPSSEKKLHREVYALKKEIGCVIHTHQEMASLAGLLGRDIPVSKQGSALLKETIPVAEYGLPGTRSLVKNASHAIGANNARTVLLANHGALCFGLDAAETLKIARQLEIECREYLAELVPLKGKEGEAGSRSMPVEITGLESDKASIPAEAMRIASSLKGEELRTMLFHSSPAVLEASNKLTHLPSYLDDFAQIAGARIAVVDSGSDSVRHGMGKNCNALLIRGIGSLCWAATRADADAVVMILEKNCKAALLALADPAVKPITWLDAQLMRFVYQKKYSKLAGKA